MNKVHIQKGQFSFGQNWKDFLTVYSEERLASAKNSLTIFTELPDFKGKTFLDIGCGSGLFSYAAYKLGAQRVMSFDLDPKSVACAVDLKNKAGNPPHWETQEGSILDEKLLARLGQFDIVYSWGVLHHTGRMWDAIINAAKLTAPRGYLYIAVYNRVPGRLGSDFLLATKKFYNRSPRAVRFIMEYLFLAKFCFSHLIRGKNPWKKMRNHAVKRGMSYRRDVSDTLGGLPYEYATFDEVFHFMREHFPDYTLVNLKTVSDIGNNWFLYRRA